MLAVDLLKLAQSAQSLWIAIAALVPAIVIYWLWARHLKGREKEALATLEDLAALGEVVPDTIHPIIDLERCIGSGACVRAGPEENVLEIVHGQARRPHRLACVRHSPRLSPRPRDALQPRL